jgi:hypothetical protein
MSIRQFVSGSSILLAGWLGVTFVREVPPNRYPKMDKTPASAGHATQGGDIMLAKTGGESEARPPSNPR